MAQVKQPMNNYFKARVYSILAMVSFVLPASVNAFDAEYFGSLLFNAQQRGEQLPDIYRIDADVDEDALYDIQKAYIAARISNGDEIGGYKGGFIPKAPVGGVLFGGKRVLQGKPSVNLNDFSLLVVEAEIGFKFCQAITAPVADITSLKKLVCEVMPVMEIADGAIADFGEVKKDFTHLRNTLISINVASSHTLVGAPAEPTTVLSSLPVSMSHNNTEIGARDLTSTFDFWQNLLWVVNEYVLANDYQIKPGQFIITGNLTGIHAAQKGTYVADFGELGKLTLEVN